MSYLDRPLREHLSVFDELRAAQIDAWNHAEPDPDALTLADVMEYPPWCSECEQEGHTADECPDGSAP